MAPWVHHEGIPLEGNPSTVPLYWPSAHQGFPRSVRGNVFSNICFSLVPTELFILSADWLIFLPQQPQSHHLISQFCSHSRAASLTDPLLLTLPSQIPELAHSGTLANIPSTSSASWQRGRIGKEEGAEALKVFIRIFQKQQAAWFDYWPGPQGLLTLATAV